MNIFTFLFSRLHTSILQHLRGPTVLEVEAWDLQMWFKYIRKTVLS